MFNSERSTLQIRSSRKILLWAMIGTLGFKLAPFIQPMQEGENPDSVFAAQSAQVIYLADPGDDQDIQPSLQATVDAASSGDTIVLPRGEFYLDGRVVVNDFISIKGYGSDEGGTLLYRREEVDDSQLESWNSMLEFRCPSDEPSHIVVSDIHFKGKNPSLVAGDGGSTANDFGVRMRNCADFVVAHNKFEHFGFAAVYVLHRDELARGLIRKNEFYQNLNIEPGSTDFNLGYGVVIYGADEGWVPDPQFGSDNFIFIEDNSFVEHRHAVAAGGTALYVFRKNEVVDNLVSQAVDAHGGGKYGNDYSARAFEIYDNHIYNTKYRDGTPITEPPPNGTCSDLPYRAIVFRGGEGLAYGNMIEGFRYGIALTTEITGTYPVNTQIGYRSGVALGSAHSGADMPAGDGDVFIWDNTFVPFDESTCLNPFVNSRQELLQEGRDYHLDTPKPGYTAYTYPHPLHALIPDPEATFVDVPRDHPYYDYIEALSQGGYTAGCSTDPPMYCPDNELNRAEGAVFFERGIHGAEVLPTQPSQQVFADVNLDIWFAKWIDALWEDGFTSGCGTDPLIFCPETTHTRAEASVFTLRIRHGTGYEPPQPSGIFADVPSSEWYAKWVEAAYDEGLIPPCETEPQLQFCPLEPVSRAEMAMYLALALGLE